MLTGAFRPAGARRAGQEAIAEASEAQEAENRAFLGQGQVRMRYHVPGMLEDGARMQQRLEIEYVVVGGGRRPHVFLHSMTSGRQPDTTRPGRRGIFAQAALASS